MEEIMSKKDLIDMTKLIEDNKIWEKKMEEKLWQKKGGFLSLDKIFEDNKKEDLIEIASFLNIKINTNLKKTDMLKKVRENYLGAVEKYVLKLSHFQFKLLCKVAKKEYVLWSAIKKDFELEYIEYFVDFGFLNTVQVEGKKALAMIPELKEIFTRKWPKFIKDIQEINFVRRNIISGLLYFYGVLTFHDISSILEKINLKVSDDDLETDLTELEFYENILEFYNGIIFKSDIPEEIVETIYFEQQSRSDLDFKIFEATEYYRIGYLEEMPINEDKEKFIEYCKSFLDTEESANHLLSTVDLMFRSGESPIDVINFIQQVRGSFESKKEIENIMQILTNINNNSPKWGLKGNTPNEIAAKFKPSKKQRMGTVISFPSGDKVGRNDSCPCGSGKKYKKCCGGSSQNESPE